VNQIVYPRSRFMELLGISSEKLRSLDTRLRSGEDKRSLERYQPKDLSTYRLELSSRPKPRLRRCQLFLNFKGGTGKTSLSTSYAYSLAEKGYRVLLVDLDSQGHASKCLGYEAEERSKTLYDVLIKRLPLSEVAFQTSLDELSIVPSNLRMSTIDLALMPLHSREFRLRHALEELAQPFDFIILDAPPSFGLLNLNAIVAADDLFIPVLADFLSFHGLKLLFETVADLEKDLQLCLKNIFVLINHYNPTTRIAREARAALEEHYAEYLLKTVVRQCTKFAQASSEGYPITAFDPASKGALDIESLIREVMPRTQSSQVKEQEA
jgi:chromosome partitioning protein